MESQVGCDVEINIVSTSKIWASTVLIEIWDPEQLDTLYDQIARNQSE